jgi:hypothetical protein
MPKSFLHLRKFQVVILTVPIKMKTHRGGADGAEKRIFD